VSEKHAVECLRCGTFRTVERERTQRLDPGECAKCGYLGWALVADLSEPVRKNLRERPPELRFRRLRVV
jgi:Zn ribbon nucleic-acid-binding protein